MEDKFTFDSFYKDLIFLLLAKNKNKNHKIKIQNYKNVLLNTKRFISGMYCMYLHYKHRKTHKIKTCNGFYLNNKHGEIKAILKRKNNPSHSAQSAKKTHKLHDWR